jgi:elongation factor P
LLSTADFRKGLKIEFRGEPCEIVDFLHSKMARGSALVKTKLRNLITGAIVDDTFRSGEKFESPQLDERQMQYLYEQDGMYYFMDVESYEQMPLNDSQLGDIKTLLKENTNVTILLYRGAPIAVDLPMFIELKVSETDPGYKGDTATGGNKLATLETGAVVKVPLHIDIGDIIRIDTRTSAYMERVK